MSSFEDSPNASAIPSSEMSSSEDSPNASEDSPNASAMPSSEMSSSEEISSDSDISSDSEEISPEENSPNASAIPSSEMINNMERYEPLYEACVEGDWDSVKCFVEDNRDDPNLWTTRIDTSGNPALCVAALSGQTELIRNLVELMPEEALLARGSYGYTALHCIAKNGDVEAAKILVTKNPLLTQIPNDGSETPLLLAARLGCKEMVRYLVTVTKDEALLARGFYGYTALHCIANNGDVEAAKILVTKNPLLTQIPNDGSETPLLLAARLGCKEMVRYLVTVTKDEALLARGFYGYTALHCIANNGDVEAAKILVTKNPLLTQIPNDGSETPLLLAARLGCKEMVLYLVTVTKDEALLARGSYGYTALHYIAKNRDVEAAKILVTKNPLLTQIPNIDSQTPLLVAAHYDCKEMVRYLLTVTKDEASDRWPSPFRGEQGAALLVSVIIFDLYDVALNLVENYEGIATATNSEGRSDSAKSRDVALDLVMKYEGIATAKNSEGMSAIISSAKKSSPDSAMSRGSTISCTNHMRKEYLKLIECICCKWHQYPLLLLHNAIKYKQKEIFHYLKHPKFKNELSTPKISDGGDTLLHLAAKRSPSHVLNKIHCPALQLQHDVKWYKEVAAMVPFYENTRNHEGKTPEDIFYEDHLTLIQEGGKWIQNIASSSMVVATLIAAVVFAAAFTVPGGIRSDMGLPFFLNKRSYLVFAVSNAMALFFSLTSVLIFLSILTSTYGIKDLVFLPRRLIIGEAMLFFAIVTMTTAFSATYFIMLGHKLAWLSILIAFFISLPVILFMILQAQFFYIFKSTYMSSL